MSSATVPPPGGANSASDTPTDIYQRVLMSNVESAIEEIILIDEQPSASELLSRGKSSAASMASLEIENDSPELMPMLYVEARADSDPIVLDEDGVAAALEDFVDRRPTVQNIPGFATLGLVIEGEELKEDPIVPNSFDPTTFDPFDPCIDDLMSLALV